MDTTAEKSRSPAWMRAIQFAPSTQPGDLGPALADWLEGYQVARNSGQCLLKAGDNAEPEMMALHEGLGRALIQCGKKLAEQLARTDAASMPVSIDDFRARLRALEHDCWLLHEPDEFTAEEIEAWEKANLS